MQWYVIVCNGHPFGVYADSMEAAEDVATAHLAFLQGARVIEQSNEVARWGCD